MTARPNETAQPQECLEALLQREYLYALFAKAFGGEPTEELLRLLVSSTTTDTFVAYEEASDVMGKCRTYLLERLGADFGSDASAAAELLDGCRSEYVRVFYGFPLGASSPSESFYCSGDQSLLSDVTLAVRDFYRRFGMLPARYPRTPDDTAALEFGFMAILARQSAEAFEKGDPKRLVELLLAQSEFLAMHLSAWVPLFAEEMLKSKQALVYPQLVQAAEAFVSVDADCVNSIAAWLAEVADEATEVLGEVEADDVARELRDSLATLDELVLPHEEENRFSEIAA